MSSPDPRTELVERIRIFHAQSEELGQFARVTEREMAEPYRRLLAHEQHMTETVEKFHRQPVTVDVLARQLTDQHYAREILLRTERDHRVVQFGIMRVHWAHIPAEIRREIEAESTPLGRILIRHNVMRQIQLQALWRVSPGPRLGAWFDLDAPRDTFGRTAVILCAGQAAIELVEIVTPVA